MVWRLCSWLSRTHQLAAVTLIRTRRCACYHNLLPTVPNHLRTPERTFPDPHIPCCSDCGSLVAVYIFFAPIEPLLNLHGEPRLLRGYDVTEVHQEATHLRGAI